MKVINADAEYLNSSNLHPYQFMEMAGRTCYKSEDKITDISASKFVSGLLKAGHTAMLEHAHIIIQTTKEHALQFTEMLHKLNYYQNNGNYSNFINISVNGRSNEIGNFISGSFRAFIQLLDVVDDYQLEYVLHQHFPELFKAPIDDWECDIECAVLSRDEFIDAVRYAYCFTDKNETANRIISKHLTHTIKFTCDRGVSHEFVRHRLASFAQESTRYCNYSKDKFGNEITFIRPSYWSLRPKEMQMWEELCKSAETTYFNLINNGAAPQEARAILPNSLKTELIVTATEVEWQHIINLRYHGTTGKPHPQMLEVMIYAYPQLKAKSDGRLK